MNGEAPRISASKARSNLARIVDAVKADDERVVLTQYGRDVAAIIPVADLKLLEEMEDGRDAAEMRRRLARSSGTVSLDDLISGLDVEEPRQRKVAAKTKK